MQTVLKNLIAMAFVPAALCMAQSEIGPLGGYGVAIHTTASNGTDSASTGFKPGAAVGGMYSEYFNEHLAGEVRYVLRFDDLLVSQGGTEVTFGARSHLIHYDFLWHTSPRQAPVRPFVAAGGGIRWVEGTGAQHPFQALSDFALLTRTREILALASVGAGVKVTLSPRMILRVEFRDYISPHMTKVIAAPPGAKFSGWIHDFVPLVGIAFTL
jgi:hypothetical protein